VILSKGCFNCPFSNLNRVSDITIGDFWGIDDVVEGYKKKKGVSLVLVNTDKGQRIFDLLPKDDYKIFEIKDDKYLGYQHNLKSPSECPENYDVFNNDYKNLGYEGTIRKYNYYSAYGRIRNIFGNIRRKIRGAH
jgi:coenzyme F420-reducing hydrogenase beta subunit